MIKDILTKNEKIIIFDGAMGTMMQKYGLKTGELPEELNFKKPEIIEKIHVEYLMAGCNIISTNTFGASAYKLGKSKYTSEQVITKAIKIAKNAIKKVNKKLPKDDRFVALDIGSIGKLMHPMGDLKFSEAYDMFTEQVKAGEKAGADLVIFETFTDVYELKAAVLAAVENTKLPIFCSITYEKTDKTLMGTDPITAVNILQDLGVDVIGTNCSRGPVEMKNVTKQLTAIAKVPIIIQPNAGLPEVVDGVTLYGLGSEDFARSTIELMEMGVSVLGGCCGTTPEYISTLCNKLKSDKELYEKILRNSAKNQSRNSKVVVGISSSRMTVFLEDKKKLSPPIIDMQKGRSEAMSYTKEGMEILHIDIDKFNSTNDEMIIEALEKTSSGSALPLFITCSNLELLEKIIRRSNGKPAICIDEESEENCKKAQDISNKYGCHFLKKAEIDAVFRR